VRSDTSVTPVSSCTQYPCAALKEVRKVRMCLSQAKGAPYSCCAAVLEACGMQLTILHRS
jgi:hypothetical protein